VLDTLSVQRCARCGFLASELASNGTIGYAEVDDTAYEAAIGALRRAQAAEVLRFTRPHVPEGDWLDVGCGPGFLLAEARAAGFRVIGIEPDAKAAALARERLGADAVRHDVFREAADPADVVSTLDVLEHVPLADLPDFATRVRRTLRDGGAWVIKVPSSEGLFFRIAHALRLRTQIERLWQLGHEFPHTVYFDRRTLTAFLERHGFAVVAHRYLQEVPLRGAVARLTLLGDMPRWQALLALPPVAAINALEPLRRRSDALLLVARPRSGTIRLSPERA
jgi:2-polyprenyl-3-methyl-5-hydroxy-6-metoxy-1,4-benzoquinol methylase